MGNVAMCAPSIISNNEVKILCNDGRLLIYTRSAIKAAEIMEMLLPMEMLFSVLTRKTTRGIKHHAASLNFYKIFPEFCLFPHASDSSVVEESDAGSVGGDECLQRFSRQRSWQPALETIVEIPP